MTAKYLIYNISKWSIFLNNLLLIFIYTVTESLHYTDKDKISTCDTLKLLFYQYRLFSDPLTVKRNIEIGDD